MLHGTWTYGGMKTDGGDFVSSGNLGYMNFPAVEGGKGDPRLGCRGACAGLRGGHGGGVMWTA